VLRTTPVETRLIVCRPPVGIPGFFDVIQETKLTEGRDENCSYFNPHAKSKSLSSLRIPGSSTTSSSKNDVVGVSYLLVSCRYMFSNFLYICCNTASFTYMNGYCRECTNIARILPILRKCLLRMYFCVL